MKNKWTLKNIPDLTGKVFLVTGGNSGIGYEAVKAFAGKGAKVILATRNVENGNRAKSNILNHYVKAQIDVLQLDLMDLESIKNFVLEVKKKYAKLDVLLNNAGIMMTPYELTKDGFESQMGTNHLGHFALTAQLFPLLKSNPGSRIVTISSAAHNWGEMDFENLLFENGRDYTPMKAYGRSKLSNLLFTYELQRIIDSNNLSVIASAAHPGVASTSLGRHLEHTLLYKALWPLVKLVVPKPENGALPGIRACTDPNVKGAQYYGPGGFGEMFGNPVVVKSNRHSKNLEFASQLWKASEKITKVQFDF